MTGNFKVSSRVASVLLAVAATAYAQHRSRSAPSESANARPCAAVVASEDVELRFEMIPARAETPALRELLAAGGAHSRAVSFEWNAATGEIDYSAKVRRFTPAADGPAARPSADKLQGCGH